jgi:hypothetical protein
VSPEPVSRVSGRGGIDEVIGKKRKIFIFEINDNRPSSGGKRTGEGKRPLGI